MKQVRFLSNIFFNSQVLPSSPPLIPSPEYDLNEVYMIIYSFIILQWQNCQDFSCRIRITLSVRIRDIEDIPIDYSIPITFPCTLLRSMGFISNPKRELKENQNNYEIQSQNPIFFDEAYRNLRRYILDQYSLFLESGRNRIYGYSLRMLFNYFHPEETWADYEDFEIKKEHLEIIFDEKPNIINVTFYAKHS